MVYLGMVYYCFTNINFFFARWPAPSKKTLQKDPRGGSKVTTAECKTTQPSLISNSIRLRMFLARFVGTTNDSSVNGASGYSTGGGIPTYLPRMMME